MKKLKTVQEIKDRLRYLFTFYIHNYKIYSSLDNKKMADFYYDKALEIKNIRNEIE